MRSTLRSQVSECFGAVLADTPLHHCTAVGESDSGLADQLALFKMRDGRVCSNYREITLVSIPGDWKGEFEQWLNF